MLTAAARLARAGSRLIGAAAGLLTALLLAFGGFALWQDAAVSRGAFAGSDLLRYKPAVLAASNPTLAELQALNPDVRGWLTVDGTNIDYPVVQGATNMDYINRDVYGDFSLSGAVFLDSRNAADFTDNYSILYGHHMENGAMFGDVSKFADADFFAAHPAGTLSLPDAAYTIELFACVEADAYDSAVYAPEQYAADAGPLLAYVKAHAVQWRDPGADGPVVALSTCAGAETNGRVVVFGRLRPVTEGDERQ
ncbi:class B sortase [Gemmiger sp.]